MPQIRQIEGFGGRYLLVNLAYVIPMGFCFWFMWRSFSSSTIGAAFMAALVGFFAFLFLGIYLDVLRLRRLRCPECRARLPWQPRNAGERLQYYCASCDTIWDTGLIESGD